MAYDRYDRDRGRESPRHSEHRQRGGRRDERGFFERAGDEIASWFGDDDGQRRHGRDGERMMNRGQWNREDRDRGEWRGGSRERDYSHSRHDSDDEEGGRTRPMDWTSSQSDYRSGSGRGFSGRDRGYRPMTGDYGRSEEDGGGYDRSESAWDRDDYRRTGYAGSEREHDRHYNAWRQRQLDELDRDYDQYHRERQEHFENDFGSWRQTRQRKRQMLAQASEHMEVVGSDGERVGKIDRVVGDRIILTKTDSPDGRLHSIPCSMIDRIEGDRLMLECKADEAQRQWRDDDRERALFEREDQGEAGPHMLDRSFSGTYR